MTLQIAFKAFLNITPQIVHAAPPPNAPPREFSLIFDDNPLTEFVELPDDALGERASASSGADGGRPKGGLWFSNVFCGVVRGALEMVRRPATTTLTSAAAISGHGAVRVGRAARG